jgi:hypothetical protein
MNNKLESQTSTLSRQSEASEWDLKATLDSYKPQIEMAVRENRDAILSKAAVEPLLYILKNKNLGDDQNVFKMNPAKRALVNNKGK